MTDPIEVKTKDFIRSTVFDSAWTCIRYDVPIRVLGVRHFIRTGEPHYLWFKLSWERADSLPLPPTREFRNHNIQETRISDLVTSIRQHGFNPHFPMQTGVNGMLVDGAHRIAVAYELQLPSVWVENLSGMAMGPIEETSDWFQTRFSKYDLKIINAVRDEMKVYCQREGIKKT